MLAQLDRLWDFSKMVADNSSRGQRLYDRLMAIKPPALKATTWAVEAGVNRAFFTNLKGKGGSVRSDSLHKLLSYIGKSEADLAGEPDLPKTNATPVHFEGASLVQVREDLPVFGTALGAEMLVEGERIEQTMLNTGDIIEYRKRPPVSHGVEKVYGLYIQGASMYPAHRDGAFIFAQRDARLRVDDDVVVYLRPKDDTDDGSRAVCVLVKRLVRRSAQFVELEQYNPAKIFRIDMKDVLQIDRVLTTDDYT
ncbi:S24 family peptidase [Sphingobium sp. Z007]|uniref:S24 family peptidase n=1 Tax=Sphingobium sp. Z007 TaxID=627495 RepID=UPI001595E489|nr:LexA family transcriptional regulator [Sphingobium sp. Z007]